MYQCASLGSIMLVLCTSCVCLVFVEPHTHSNQQAERWLLCTDHLQHVVTVDSWHYTYCHFHLCEQHIGDPEGCHQPVSANYCTHRETLVTKLVWTEHTILWLMQALGSALLILPSYCVHTHVHTFTEWCASCGDDVAVDTLCLIPWCCVKWACSASLCLVYHV